MNIIEYNNIIDNDNNHDTHLSTQINNNTFIIPNDINDFQILDVNIIKHKQSHFGHGYYGTFYTTVLNKLDNNIYKIYDNFFIYDNDCNNIKFINDYVTTSNNNQKNLNFINQLKTFIKKQIFILYPL